jgi:hypothetical protein
MCTSDGGLRGRQRRVKIRTLSKLRVLHPGAERIDMAAENVMVRNAVNSWKQVVGQE